MSRETDLYIFSDGPKNEKDLIIINTVRNYLDTITGFRKIERNYSSVNKGLASSIIEGVTLIIKKYGKVIVVEDDLIVSSNFLDWMNQALVKFQFENNIFSVLAFLPKLNVGITPMIHLWLEKLIVGDGVRGQIVGKQ